MPGTPAPQVPKSVVDLIARFDANLDAYKSPTYNETQLRREFVDPFFEALGWDVHNRQGFAEPYKDVIHEDRTYVATSAAEQVDDPRLFALKSPDYSFRVGGVRKFFVETKKPSVKIETDPLPAFQLRRYAFSAKLPLSILTDFEHFAVYDGRIKPSKNDKPSVARVGFFHYSDFVAKWHELASVFSKDAILTGSFDIYADTNKRKRGTSEVTDEFLKEIESWRDALARNIAARNALTQRQLNFAVQRVIDRIIFLRICEDRGIEDYARLHSISNGPDVYARLVELFRRADARFNSGIFHFNREADRDEAPDDLTPSLVIEDKVLRPILRSLYYPECPFEFSVIPAEILGHVYEQFLGKVIDLKPSGHRIEIIEKPEVRKAGGVYYTPTHIVQYIVKSTIGTLLEGKTPKDATNLRLLDPACGSGSFLIVAYQHLLDWHLEHYERNDPDKWLKRSLLDEPEARPQGGRSRGARSRKALAPALYRTERASLRLTPAERKRILTTCIYGVDIDSQAVEVTKLSLLLKVLEGETTHSLGAHLWYDQERALPDLGRNIKCGNSLIARDFYANRQIALLGEDERFRINVFDWDREFAPIMDHGGFDAVIGNPPYIDSEWMTRHQPETRQYCSGRYSAASGNWDIFCVFLEKAIDLLRDGGRMGMIVPNKLCSAGYAAGIREALVSRSTLSAIRDYSSVKVFPVAVYPIIIISTKGTSTTPQEVLYEHMIQNPSGLTCDRIAILSNETLRETASQTWRLAASDGETQSLDSLLRGCQLLDHVATVLGAATVSEAYEIKPVLSESQKNSPAKGDLALVNSGTVDRYKMLWGTTPTRYLGTSFARPIVAARDTGRLPAMRLEQSKRPKIIISGMTKRLECALDQEGKVIAGKSTTIVLSRADLRVLLAIINSRLIAYYYDQAFGSNRLAGGYLRIGPPQIRTIPIPSFDNPSPKVQKILSHLTALVDEILLLLGRSTADRTSQEVTAITRQIEATDSQIDLLIYKLYGLSDAEARIVEKATEHL